ncbi:hypothetical protein ZWY2020_009440 [Hordeum vulgare]|nr:hypothetical protein ZWY2020_009440 [Hordeum vulgare]
MRRTRATGGRTQHTRCKKRTSEVAGVEDATFLHSLRRLAHDLAAVDPQASFLRAVFASVSRRLLHRGTPTTPAPQFSPASSSSSGPLPSSLPPLHRLCLAITHRRAVSPPRALEHTGEGKKDLIESLPRFTMASTLVALPRSSPDCLSASCPLGRRPSCAAPGIPPRVPRLVSAAPPAPPAAATAVVPRTSIAPLA